MIVQSTKFGRSLASRVYFFAGRCMQAYFWRIVSAVVMRFLSDNGSFWKLRFVEQPQFTRTHGLVPLVTLHEKESPGFIQSLRLTPLASWGHQNPVSKRMSGLSRVSGNQVGMAVSCGSLKLACALLMFSIFSRVCSTASAGGDCPWRTCSPSGVSVRYPFSLQNDALSGRCYTRYTDLHFQCLNEFLYLNFTSNVSYFGDIYKVTDIDYNRQTLSLVPEGPAACRPFNSNRFGGLNITNTTTLLLDCPSNIHGSCTFFRGTSNVNVCNSTGRSVHNSGAGRWVCKMELNEYREEAYSACHFIESGSHYLGTLGSTALVLQFAGNKTLSFTNFTSPALSSIAVVVNRQSIEGEGGSSTGGDGDSIIIGVISGVIGTIFLLIFLPLFCRVCISGGSGDTEAFGNLPHSTTLYTLEELERATHNFSDDMKLGSGGFGTVYKGTLDNGVKVAVKRTNRRMGTKGIKEQFMNEVTLLSQVNHRNLVRLHGCCLEVEVPMLVFEYVPNGDLFQHLQGERPEPEQLTWAKRLQIAIDTAEALRYLHSAAYPPIYHRDMKTSNILLDDKLNPKVADFGISKLVQPDATHVSTTVQGTLGYLDPEYFRTFQLTDKSDVYSFGMVLLELITSLKPVDFERGGEDVTSLMTMALPFIQDGNVMAIADSRLFNDNSHDDVAVQMQRVAELAIRCLAESRYRRPTMKEVVAEMVAIRGDENRPGHDSSDMDHEDVEMVPVLYSQSSNITSSFEISHAPA